jgi:hypothetical protein
VEIAIACTGCFGNFGFKKALVEFAHQADGPCPNCGFDGALKLGRSGLERAILEFFVYGSYTAGTFAPVYQVNTTSSWSAIFDPTLNSDAKLASALTESVIFDYGPPTWRVGHGELRDEFDAGGELRYWAARDLVRAGESAIIPADTLLFRVRVNPKCDESISTPDAFDPPPVTMQREVGRLDDVDHPVLYISDDIELCLHECRVVLSDEIVVASLSTTRELRLLDLCGDIKWPGGTPFQDPNIFVSYTFRNRRDSLEHCRIISRAARDAGYDGIRYMSYYAQAKHHPASLNLAIFGRPIGAGLLRLESVNRVRISDMTYAFRLGPVLYRDTASHVELAEKVKAFSARLERIGR